jgi:hypothetical protein
MSCSGGVSPAFAGRDRTGRPDDPADAGVTGDRPAIAVVTQRVHATIAIGQSPRSGRIESAGLLGGVSNIHHCSSAAGGFLMSTARDPSYHDEYFDAGDRPTPAGTRFQSDPSGFRSASEERLLAPTAAVPAAAPQYGIVQPYPASQPGPVDRQRVVARQHERFGGIKFGAAFFGWMAAAGIAALLTALLSAGGVVLTLTSNTSTTDISNQASAATGAAKTVSLVGAILLLIVLFVAYFCGGYVAGRMARFSGTKQGLAVWLWSVLFAVVIAIVVKVAGSKYNILSNLNLPHIPVRQGDVTTAAIIAIAAIVVVTLGAALLGGHAGMHFHRRVDEAGLGL